MVASLGPMPMATAKHTDTLFRFTDSNYVMNPDNSFCIGCFLLTYWLSWRSRVHSSVSVRMRRVHGGRQRSDLAPTIHARSHTGLTSRLLDDLGAARDHSRTLFIAAARHTSPCAITSSGNVSP